MSPSAAKANNLSSCLIGHTLNQVSKICMLLLFLKLTTITIKFVFLTTLVHQKLMMKLNVCLSRLHNNSRCRPKFVAFKDLCSYHLHKQRNRYIVI